MLHFLGCPDTPEPHEEYCRICRALGEDDCEHCDPTTIRELTDG